MNKRLNNLKAGIAKAPSTGAIAFFVILFVAMSIAKPNFATVNTYRVIMQSAMITIVVGISQMVSLTIGGMNLAIGAMGGASAVICTSMLENLGFAPPIAILIGLAAGAIFGILNGTVIFALGSTPVITWLITMGTSYVFMGIQKAWNRGIAIHVTDESFTSLGSDTFLGLPVLMYVVAAICILLSLLYKYTGFGRQMLAFGANNKAATMNGISTKRIVISAHALSGLLAACAGIILSMRLGAGTADIGAQWGFYSFAAPIIGGTEDGRCSILGTFVAGLVLATIESALVHLGLDLYWSTLVKGCVILFAVSFNAYRDHALAKRR